MGYTQYGAVELPVGIDEARAAVHAVLEDHELVSVRRSGAEAVDVVARSRDKRGEERVRLTFGELRGGSSIVEHGSWGLRGTGSQELYDALVAELAQQLRTRVARDLIAATDGATGAYVGTLVGQEQLDVRLGAAVAVVFGATRLSLCRGRTRFDLVAEQLLEVEAVPVNTPGMPWDRTILLQAAGRAGLGTVIGIAATTGLEALVHVTGSTTSVVSSELTRLREAAHPAPVAAVVPVAAPSRRAPGEKPTATELVREMASLAQLHREGLIDDGDFAAAKAELLGTVRA